MVRPALPRRIIFIKAALKQLKWSVCGFFAAAIIGLLIADTNRIFKNNIKPFDWPGIYDLRSVAPITSR
jgi:hypothetical protein